MTGHGSSKLRSASERPSALTSPINGTLSLNPGVERPPRTPRCPDCEQDIKLVEADGGRREYRCGCDGVHRFEIPAEAP